MQRLLTREYMVTKGEKHYAVSVNGIVVAQSETAQGCADYLWAMLLPARWTLYYETNKEN